MGLFDYSPGEGTDERNAFAALLTHRNRWGVKLQSLGRGLLWAVIVAVNLLIWFPGVTLVGQVWWVTMIVLLGKAASDVGGKAERVLRARVFTETETTPLQTTELIEALQAIFRPQFVTACRMIAFTVLNTLLRLGVHLSRITYEEASRGWHVLAKGEVAVGETVSGLILFLGPLLFIPTIVVFTCCGIHMLTGMGAMFHLLSHALRRLSLVERTVTTLLTLFITLFVGGVVVGMVIAPVGVGLVRMMDHLVMGINGVPMSTSLLRWEINVPIPFAMAFLFFSAVMWQLGIFFWEEAREVPLEDIRAGVAAQRKRRRSLF